MKCPRCGFTGSDEAAACRKCGNDLAEARRALGLGTKGRPPRASTPIVDGPVDPTLIDDAPPPAGKPNASSILDLEGGLHDTNEGDSFDAPADAETDLDGILAETDPVEPTEISTVETEATIDFGEPIDPGERPAGAREWPTDDWGEIESDLGTARNPRAIPKGGFWLRVVASMIDSIFMQIVSSVALFAAAIGSGATGVMAAHLPGPGADPVASAQELEAALLPLLKGPLGWTLLVLLVSASLYRPVCHWRWGMTLGKKIVGLRVVTTQGERLGFGRACWRDLAYLISSLPLGLGLLWVAWDPQKQGWHDKLAGTYVLKENP